jgi:hypothetical protein
VFIPEFGSGYRRKNPRVVEIPSTGVPRKCGLQLGEIGRAFIQRARLGGQRESARRSNSSLLIYSAFRTCPATHRDLSRNSLSHWQKRFDIYFMAFRTGAGTRAIDQF